MNTSAVVRELSRRTGLSPEITQRVVNEFFEIITESLEERKEVRLGNFGVFKPVEKAPRVARNLQRDAEGRVIVAGEVNVPRRVKVQFRPGIALKERAEKSLDDAIPAVDEETIREAAPPQGRPAPKGRPAPAPRQPRKRASGE